MIPDLTVLQGDSLVRLKEISDASVQSCATSPPYYGLRDYGHEGQIGREESPQAYIDKLVAVFREVRRLLKDDGVLWLNLGDSYTGSGGTSTDGVSGLEGSRDSQTEAKRAKKFREGSARADREVREDGNSRRNRDGLKAKNLLMIPQRVALALQADGWYLRSQIPWVKRNCMPESTSDRPTSAVEYVFLLSKSERYFYDADGIAVPVQSGPSDVRKMMESKERIGGKSLECVDDLAKANSGTNIGKKGAVGGKLAKNETSCDRRKEGFNERWEQKHTARLEGDSTETKHGDDIATGLTRNRRNSDWFFESLAGMISDEEGDPLAFLVNSQPYKEAHFAVWPERLVRPMILASTRPGDVVLEPFAGSGTTGKVALELGRSAILIELNPEYCKLIEQRCRTTPGLPLE